MNYEIEKLPEESDYFTAYEITPDEDMGRSRDSKLRHLAKTMSEVLQNEAFPKTWVTSAVPGVGWFFKIRLIGSFTTSSAHHVIRPFLIPRNPTPTTIYNKLKRYLKQVNSKFFYVNEADQASPEAIRNREELVTTDLDYVDVATDRFWLVEATLPFSVEERFGTDNRPLTAAPVYFEVDSSRSMSFEGCFKTALLTQLKLKRPSFNQSEFNLVVESALGSAVYNGVNPDVHRGHLETLAMLLDINLTIYKDQLVEEKPPLEYVCWKFNELADTKIDLLFAIGYLTRTNSKLMAHFWSITKFKQIYWHNDFEAWVGEENVSPPSLITPKELLPNSAFSFPFKEVVVFWDTETFVQPEKGRDLCVYAVGFNAVLVKNGKPQPLVQTTTYLGETAMASFADFLIETMTRAKKVLLVSYNGSGFDHFFLMQQRKLLPFLVSVLPYNGCLLQLAYSVGGKGKLITFDLYRFTMRSLKATAKAFNCVLQKGAFDHEEFQAGLEDFSVKDRWRYVRLHHRRIEKYLKLDVEVMAEMFWKCKTATEQLIPEVVFERCITLSQLCFKGFTKANPTWDPNPKFDEFIRASCIGGRTQVYPCNNFLYNGDIGYIDVNSLYPTVMLLDEYDYPPFDAVLTEVEEKDLEDVVMRKGFFLIRYNPSPNLKINVIPKTTDKHDWKTKEEITRVVNHVDLQGIIAEDPDVNVVILRALVYEESEWINPFRDFLQPILDEKRRQRELQRDQKPSYNPVLCYMCKLLANSLYGKFGQKVRGEEVAIVRTEKEFLDLTHRCFLSSFKTLTKEGGTHVIKATKRVLSPYSFKNVAYASLILSYSRRLMRRYLRDIVSFSPDAFFYTDTDSIWSSKEAIVKLKSKYPNLMGEELGQFKDEIDDSIKIERAYAIAPKVYALIREGEENLYTFKGVSQQKDFFITEDEANRISNIQDALDVYESNRGNVLNETHFQTLLRQEKLYSITKLLVSTTPPHNSSYGKKEVCRLKIHTALDQISEFIE